MTDPSPTDPLAVTRLALHTVAEHVLAPARFQADGHIGLRPVEDGFATPSFPTGDGPRQIRVVGAELVVTDDRGERRAALSTVRAAGELAGVVPGARPDVYPPATALDLDAPLVVDPDQARVLANWWALGAAALAELGADLAESTGGAVPDEPQLWPEHFDLGTSYAKVNYGVSPGDEPHPQPYLYVGPWEPPAPDGGYWNEPFGASIGRDRVADVADALAFFRRGARLD
jgi:hypothetical protein